MWKFLTAVDAFFEASMSDVAPHNNSAVERQASRNRIFVEFLEDFAHRLVQVDEDDWAERDAVPEIVFVNKL